MRDEVDACGRRRRSSPHRHGESVRVRFDLAVAEYGAITAPTLVVWTSDDPTADVGEGKRIASMIPGARFEVMSGCGHWPQYEDPKTFNRLHLDFLLGR